MPKCDHGIHRPGPDDWRYLESAHGFGVRECKVCGARQVLKWVDVPKEDPDALPS